jgi:hypothetical protein
MGRIPAGYLPSARLGGRSHPLRRLHPIVPQTHTRRRATDRMRPAEQADSVTTHTHKGSVADLATWGAATRPLRLCPYVADRYVIDRKSTVPLG